MEHQAEVGDLIMRAARQLRRGWVASLEPWQIAPHEFRALRAAVEADGGARLADIADRLRIAPRSATEVVDALEDKELVRRVPSPTDRRAVLVEPTPRGIELAEALARARADINAQVLAPLEPREIEVLRVALRRLVEAEPPHDHP